MQFHNLARKIQRNFVDYGLSVTLKKGVLYPFSALFESRVYRIYSINLEALDDFECKNNNFSYKFIGIKHIEIIRQIELMEEWLKGQVQERLEGKGICLVALDKERVAGFNLVSFGEIFIPLLTLTKVLPDNEAWSDQITVHHNYRRRGLASNLRFRIFRELKAKGITKLYGGALKSNIASLKLARRTGFREVSDIHYLKIFGFKKWKTIELNLN